MQSSHKQTDQEQQQNLSNTKQSDKVFPRMMTEHESSDLKNEHKDNNGSNAFRQCGVVYTDSDLPHSSQVMQFPHHGPSPVYPVRQLNMRSLLPAFTFPPAPPEDKRVLSFSFPVPMFSNLMPTAVVFPPCWRVPSDRSRGRSRQVWEKWQTM